MANINNDADFTSGRVTKEGRKSNLSMFMVMLGFTFFSASMWAGQNLAAGLDFAGFIGAIILGGIILGAYTGTLGYIGAETGLTSQFRPQGQLAAQRNDQLHTGGLVRRRSGHVCHPRCTGAVRT